jgi:hypothetical protein
VNLFLSVAAIPVLVELFTSEGCSSCPPADELLRKIRSQPPAAGVELITLSEHVDYWDYIGWKDPNASPAFTARQRDYAAHFRARGPYTPQMVVDGVQEFVGSDARALVRAIGDAAKRGPKLPLRLSIGEPQGRPRRLSIAFEAAALPAGVELIVAITQNGVASNVTRGENGGRRLEHDSVVRWWKPFPADTRQVELPDVVVSGGGDTAVVVFAQEKRSRRVVAAASLPL